MKNHWQSWEQKLSPASPFWEKQQFKKKKNQQQSFQLYLQNHNLKNMGIKLLMLL